MTDFKIIPLAAALALASCSAAYSDQTEIAAQSTTLPRFEPIVAEDLSCDVTAEPTANGVLIEAHAFANNRDVYGEYELAITKSGGGGSSDVSQGGQALIAAGTEETLGQTELSVERGSRIRAQLVVRDELGELCRRSVRL